ncbi:GNAT family N-acetyltransferase [Serinibacter arcticus]|uniref:GNAT family N-acetyltransferase n=1 Tax=Serinibacter arcticus TaxID=1655435 RepID=A0A2U1ZYJ9_9MICO|nr:GNAT family N-acetyltransferase [Serinibacter arcticus]PWD51992.1 GNAT family N-acetyltransferase [Serinibacter arcticus]
MTETSPHIGVREITPSDGEFLVDMVLEAANWETAEGGEPRLNRRHVLTTPRLARYANGWGRQGDLGLVAFDLDGPSGLQIPVGAAWIRYFPSTEPGYGFLEPGVPELSMAIIPGRRRLGIGRALLGSLLVRAREGGARRLSLSVGATNPARHLYEQSGFVVVEDQPRDGELGSSLTMVAELGPVASSTVPSSSSTSATGEDA